MKIRVANKHTELIVLFAALFVLLVSLVAPAIPHGAVPDQHAVFWDIVNSAKGFCYDLVGGR